MEGDPHPEVGYPIFGRPFLSGACVPDRPGPGAALEQVRFLRRFRENRLGISPKTRDAVRSILLQESGPGYRLYAKTGGGTGVFRDTPKRALGWYVGFVEKTDRVVYFALNIDGTDFKDIVAPRPRITKAVLRELGILP